MTSESDDAAAAAGRIIDLERETAPEHPIGGGSVFVLCQAYAVCLVGV
jgi:hypothetical protein